MNEVRLERCVEVLRALSRADHKDDKDVRGFLVRYGSATSLAMAELMQKQEKNFYIMNVAIAVHQPDRESAIQAINSLMRDSFGRDGITDFQIQGAALIENADDSVNEIDFFGPIIDGSLTVQPLDDQKIEALDYEEWLASK